MYTANCVNGGVPEGNRTPDPRFRKPVLYPAELPGQRAAQSRLSYQHGLKNRRTRIAAIAT